MSLIVGLGITTTASGGRLPYYRNFRRKMLTDGRTDKLTDTPSSRDALSHLKKTVPKSGVETGSDFISGFSQFDPDSSQKKTANRDPQ